VHGYALKRECDLMPMVELKPVPDRPIDWRKVAASLREGERAADTQIAKGLRHAEQIAAVAVVGMICHVMAAAIEDGLA
jgi:hypothetical protein